MKIEIEIDEEQAACLWADHQGVATSEGISEIISEMACEAANKYRREFPAAVDTAVANFRARQITS